MVRDPSVFDEPMLAAIDDVHAAVERERLEHEQRVGERDAGERRRLLTPGEIELVVPERHEIVGDRREPNAEAFHVLGDSAGFREPHVEYEALERERFSGRGERARERRGNERQRGGAAQNVSAAYHRALLASCTARRRIARESTLLWSSKTTRGTGCAAERAEDSLPLPRPWRFSAAARRRAPISQASRPTRSTTTGTSARSSRRTASSATGPTPRRARRT